MKAAVLLETGRPMEIMDLTTSAPIGREVLIRVIASGLCASDVSVAKGNFPGPIPCVLGHESSGIVEAVGSDVSTLKLGDHVVTCISGFCGRCEQCLTGHLSLCRRGAIDRPKGAPPRLVTWDGTTINQCNGLAGFAEMMTLHENSCSKISPDMPLDLASVIGCAVTTGWGAVTRTAKVTPGSTVAVIGCGGIGLMLINAAAISGASRIIAIDRLASKLELAKTMGATDVLQASEDDLAKQVIQMTRGGVNYSFEAIGRKDTCEAAFRMLRVGGQATIVGVPPIGTKLEIDTIELLSERKIQGSYVGSNIHPVDTPMLVDFYLSGRLKLDELVANRIRLEDINQGFANMASGESARTVVLFND